jgi:hypothetical protein
MVYPQFVGSAMHSIRLMFKPSYRFKIECNDSIGRKTIMVLADLTTKKAGAVDGVPVTITS